VGDKLHHSGTGEFFSEGILFEPVILPEKIYLDFLYLLLYNTTFQKIKLRQNKE
jgi:hypothetical protein